MKWNLFVIIPHTLCYEMHCLDSATPLIVTFLTKQQRFIFACLKHNRMVMFLYYYSFFIVDRYKEYTCFTQKPRSGQASPCYRIYDLALININTLSCWRKIVFQWKCWKNTVQNRKFTHLSRMKLRNRERRF